MDKTLILLGFFVGVVLTSALFIQFSPSIGITSNVISAPSAGIYTDNITAYPNHVIIYIQNATISNYANTGSMMPMLNENAHGIEIKPTNESQINVGDIISFNQSGIIIVHRVVEKGYDSKGLYFITKGDSSDIPDSPIRFSDIQYKTVGVLY